MAYINPGQLFQEYFQPTVHSVLPIVPSLMADKRSQIAEAIAAQKWINEAPLRAAQTRHYNAQAEEAESANKIRNQILGGTNDFAGYGIKPEDVIRKGLGLSARPQPTLKPVFQPSTTPGQPGQYVYGEPKIGDIAKPEPEAQSKLEYWIKGPDNTWKQTSEMVPKETYNQRMKEILSLIHI